MPPYIVVDASIAGAFLFAESLTLRATTIFDAMANRRVIALMPDRFEEELLRICQKKLQLPPQGPGISVEDAFGRFLDLMTAPALFDLLPSNELHERAWQLAVATSGLTTHDALYIALAERWSAELWTADNGQAAGTGYAKVYNLRTASFRY